MTVSSEDIHKIFKAVPPMTVGLGFKEQIVENLPMDKHDFKIDVVISP